MVSAVAEKQNIGQTFTDMNGNCYAVASIDSMSRNLNQASVSMSIDGQILVVEVASTEANNIMELLS